MLYVVISMLIGVPMSLDMPDYDYKFDIDIPHFETRGPHSFDVLNYDIAFELFEADSSIQGITAIHFEAVEASLDQIQLDLIALEVDSVWDGSGVLAWVQAGDSVVIDLSSPLESGDTLTVFVAYGGFPTNYFFAGFYANSELPPHVTFFSIGMGPKSGRYIYPCWDDIYDKASFEFHATVNDSLYAVSCGELTGIDYSGGKATFNWSNPEDMSTYIWAFAISDYIVVKDTTYPWIEYYTFPDYLYCIEQIFGNVDQMIDCFEDLFCPYPWSTKLGFPFVRASNIYCEHNTIPYTLAPETIVAHEISHMWWGNMVTEEDWPEIWLAEGFATYCQCLWEGYSVGSEAYDEMILSTMNSYLNSGELFPIVPADDYWCFTTYNKGASVLHMLRFVIGDTIFFDALKLYLSDNAYGSTTTEDLIASFETVYGSDLNWFFDTWVYDWAYPDYNYSWNTFQTGSNWDITIYLDQEQVVGPVFVMPVDFLISGSDTDTLVTMWNELQNDSETFTLPFQPTGVILDPLNHILHADLPGVGIEEEPENTITGMRIIPNPAVSLIGFECATEAGSTASVYDLSGRCVLRMQLQENQNMLNVADLPSGSYTLRIESDGIINTGSFVILMD